MNALSSVILMEQAGSGSRETLKIVMREKYGEKFEHSGTGEMVWKLKILAVGSAIIFLRLSFKVRLGLFDHFVAHLVQF